MATGEDDFNLDLDDYDSRFDEELLGEEELTEGEVYSGYDMEGEFDLEGEEDIGQGYPEIDGEGGAARPYVFTAPADSKSKTDQLTDFLLGSIEEEVKEESSLTEESEPTPLNRIPYYLMFLEAMRDYGMIKRMNNFLHKKMGDYFKKRKMEHVLKEIEHTDEAYNKYGKRLDNFSVLIDMDTQQRKEITKELREMKEIRDRQSQESERRFKEMVNREHEIGKGLISTKTGKEIPDKMLEKMISNQKSKAKELSLLRLTHIKIRNAVTAKQAAIRALDRVGENYTLMEFEQLKIENQGLLDKVEERDEELSKLRSKCHAAIQCLAHVREKASAVETNIKNLRIKLDEKEYEKAIVRERMNELRQTRDYFRHEAQRMKEENGLMTKDKLLLDLENSMNETTIMDNKIKRLEERCERTKQNLTMLKINFEKEKRRQRYRQKFKSLSLPEAHLIEKKPKKQGWRPTIIFPKFENFQ